MSVNRQRTFDALAIRDTNLKSGDVVFNGDFVIKTIVIENSLNQAVTLQCQASINSDFSNSFNVGSSFQVEATTNTYQTCGSYFPYMRLTAQCASSPTSGTLSVTLLGV